MLSEGHNPSAAPPHLDSTCDGTLSSGAARVAGTLGDGAVHMAGTLGARAVHAVVC